MENVYKNENQAKSKVIEYEAGLLNIFEILIRKQQQRQP
ncbi:hypothetical protein QF042_005165 [Pedobacter sp. W3I1]|nr:hypothetical protein [Pedobacter sp. W3I1]